MKHRIISAVVCLLVIALGTAFADFKWEYAEGKECSIGADVRVRLTHIDRNVWDPNAHGAGSGWETGPAWEYMRVRERVWGCFELNEKTKLQLRLVNRWHAHSSKPGDNSNHDGVVANGPGPGWTFPDELIVDNLFLDLANVADSDWSLRLGRQDIMFGNGMVLLEGTPLDGGRTIYFDGIVAKYASEADSLALFLVHNKYKDGAVLAGDENRALHFGDTTAAGAYWTHNFDQALNTDLYYIYADLDDDHEVIGPSASKWRDFNREVHYLGARVFGSPHDQVDYSVEVCKQYGRAPEIETSSGGGSTSTMWEGFGADLSGLMVDARLTLKAPAETAMDPKLMLQYTFLSGDDPDSQTENEGWQPVFSAWPKWRDELFAYGVFPALQWTNLSQFRTAIALAITEDITFSTAWAYVNSDEPSDAGRQYGNLFTAFLDYKITDAWVVKLEASEFRPGNWFMDGTSCEWLRLETVYRF